MMGTWEAGEAIAPVESLVLTQGADVCYNLCAAWKGELHYLSLHK